MIIKKSSTDELSEEQLKDKREELEEKTEVGIEEVLLQDQRKEDGSALLEKMLRKKKPSGNEKLEGLTEKRLNDASKDMYPHRNEDAWKRTGDKRPVNALNEEMGEGGDEGKLKRWDAAQKKSPGLPDKAVAGFNQKRAEEEKKVKIAHEDIANYLTYKTSKNPWSPTLIEAKKVDEEMVAILHKASLEGRPLTAEEMSKIDELKKSKTEVLGVRWRNAI